MPLNQEARKRSIVIILNGVIDPNYQEETGELLHSGDKESYVWNLGDIPE